MVVFADRACDGVVVKNDGISLEQFCKRFDEWDRADTGGEAC